MRGCPSSFCFPQRKGGLPSLPPADSAGACPLRGLSRAALARPATVENSMGACLARHVLSLPLVCFLPPIPPTPFPAGRGVFRLFHARGFAPCIPGAEPEAALARPATEENSMGACLARHVLSLPLVCFLPPIPPTPFPAGRGVFRLFHARGFAPCIPGLSRRRHLQPLPKQKPCGGLAPGRHWLALPRGRGPSQTPPSRATDSSISPGPPPSLAAGTANRKAALSVLRRVGEAKGTAPRGAPVRQGL